MAASIFEFVAEALEDRTALAKLEARGTVRLALKEAGLDAQTVTAEQMAVVLAKVMPGEVRARGIERAEELCQGIAAALTTRQAGDATGAESPEAIFRRLAES